MNKFETKFFLFALIGWIATGAQAHTLLNGSFEAVDKSLVNVGVIGASGDSKFETHEIIQIAFF